MGWRGWHEVRLGAASLALTLPLLLTSAHALAADPVTIEQKIDGMTALADWVEAEDAEKGAPVVLLLHGTLADKDQELIDALGSSPPRLSPDAYYRIDRHDLAAPVPLHFGECALNGRVQDLLEWCRRNVSAVQVDTRICSARGALYK